MTQLAGFDVVIEVEDDAITRLLRSKLVINDAPASPPFELVTNVSSPLAKGSIQLIIDDLTLTCQTNDVATLRVGFSCWTINLATLAGPVTANGLVGSWDFAIPASDFLRPDPGGLALGLAATSLPVPTAHLTADSFASLDAVAPGGANAFLDLVAPQVRAQFVAALPLTLATFAIDASQDGQMGTPPRFVSLEAHCVTGPGVTRPALGLFGILLASRLGQGSIADKTAPVLPAGADLAMMLSPDAFRMALVCNALASRLGIPVTDLPTTCGSGSMDYGGATIERIDVSLHDSFVQLGVRALYSFPCGEATCNLGARLDIVMDGGNLKAEVTPGQPDIDIDFDFLCKLAFGGFAPLPGLLQFIDSVGGDIVAGFLPALPGLGFQANRALFPGATPNSATVSPDGFTLGASILAFSPPAPEPDATLTDQVVQSSPQVINTGTFHWEAGECLEGDWPYTEQYNTTTQAFMVTYSLLCRPVITTWNVAGHELSGTGQLNLSVTTWPPVPPDAPSVPSTTQQVTVIYEAIDDELRLSNIASEGNYALPLECTVQDQHGTAFVLTDRYVVGGHTFETPEFDAQFQYCVGKAIKDDLRKHPVGGTLPLKPDPTALIAIGNTLQVLPEALSTNLLRAFDRRFGPRLAIETSLKARGVSRR